MGKRLLGIIVLAGLLLLPPPPANGLYLLDVGQGDAILLTTDQGHTLLVDGGAPGSVLLPLSAVGVGEIDILVATHYDADHAGGLIDVLETYTVHEVWLPSVEPHTETAERLWQLVQAENAQVRFPQAGDHFTLDAFNISVLSPDPNAPPSSDTSTNDQAVVLGVSLGITDIFLTSDAPASRVQSAWERWLSETPPSLPLEILKVGHHGSTTSTTTALVTQLQPQLAVISVGVRNRYGHPAAQTLQTLEQAGVPVQRTDQQGTLRFLVYPDGRVAQENRPPGILAWLQYLSTTHPRTQLTDMLYFWHAKKIQTSESPDTQGE
ncbi:MAG: MBL fold metallo-hydrolase [Patescibacteria group bacterium]